MSTSKLTKLIKSISIESDSSSSSSSSSTSTANNNNNNNNNNLKIDILFDKCHWYDIPCPHRKCYESNVRFDCHDKFKLHHEQLHCPRGENGDIDRAKDSLRWQCPVTTHKIIDGIECRKKCDKISNSWYNYAGHITSHREIGHGWGCALEPEGKRKKTNCKRFGKIVCGKRTSTKHHLLAHMANVHKSYNVIDTNGRQYNKKKDRKPRTSKGSISKSIIGKKRKFMDINDNDEEEVIFMKENRKKSHNNTSLLQMALPQFPKLGQSLPQFPNLFNSKNRGNTSNVPPLLNFNHLFPFGSIQQQPPLKKMRLIPQSEGKQCIDNEWQQFEFLCLLCKAADTHKGCIKCNGCDDIEGFDDDTMESSLPSLCAYNSNSSKSAGNVSPSMSDQTNLTTTNKNLEIPKLPQLSTLSLNTMNKSSIFPNLLSQTITNNVPFTFDLNQLCSSNNATTTNNNDKNTKNTSNQQQTPSILTSQAFVSFLKGDGLKNGVISTAIPSLPSLPTFSTKF